MKQYLLIIAIVCFGKLYGQIDTTSNLPDSEKIYGLSVFWKEAAYNFAYFDKANINWDSAYCAFIPQVLQTRNTYQYYKVLQRFAALLSDGHTAVYIPSDLSHGSSNTQVHFTYLQGRVIVQNVVAEDSLLVPFGSEVLSVNGQSTEDYLHQQVFPYVSSSTKHWRYKRAMNMMYPTGDTNTVTRLLLKKPNGDTATYYTRLTPENKQMAYDYRLIKSTTFRELNNGIVYLSIYSFQDTSVVTRFRTYLPQLYKARGIILDLRRNGGGDSDVGIEILKYFTNQKRIVSSAAFSPLHIAYYKARSEFNDLKDTSVYPFRKEEIRKAYQIGKHNYWDTIPPEIFVNGVRDKKIEAPLVVLIGNETASAAEDFLVALDGLKGRAIKIGEKTEGSTGQPLYFDLPGGGSARICTLRETYPDGKEFVGYGIAPDIEVVPTMDDLFKSRDGALEKAVDYLISHYKIK